LLFFYQTAKSQKLLRISENKKAASKFEAALPFLRFYKKSNKLKNPIKTINPN